MTSPEDEGVPPLPPLQPFTMSSQPSAPEAGPGTGPGPVGHAETAAEPAAPGTGSVPAGVPGQAGPDATPWSVPSQPAYGSPYAGYQQYPGAATANQAAAGDPALAGRWRRLAARIIDGVVLALVLTPFWVGPVTSFFHQVQHLAAQYPNGAGPGFQSALANAQTKLIGSLLLLEFASATVSFAYDWVQHALWGQTLGKRAMGTKVVRADTRGPVGWGPAAARAAVYALVPVVPTVGSIFALLNELWLLWDPRRQCLHDKAARTIVVRKNALPPAP